MIKNIKLLSLILSSFLFTIYSNVDANEAQRYNQISLTASAATEVNNDMMVVTMYAQKQGVDVAALASEVNQQIKWALDTLKPQKKIRVQTENYTTYPVYKKNNIEAWRVKQTIKLQSTDIALLTKLLAQLQNKLKLGSVQFDVSRPTRQQQTKQLINKALDSFQLQAKQITKKLNFQHYKIVDLKINTPSNYPRPMPMMAEMRVAAAPPAFAAGDKTLTIQVNAVIELY